MEFIHENFILESDAAKELYHSYAMQMPIIDYHNHLNTQQIAEDHHFTDISELWLSTDHYKWRALRANGIDERYITGSGSSWQKFEAWASTLPYTMRGALYHWSALEMKRYFNIDTPLSPSNARNIFDQCNEALQDTSFSVRNLLLGMNVEELCTTDDPCDSLEHHLSLMQEGFAIKVRPSWRPDKTMAVEDPMQYKAYIKRLGEVADIEIRTLDDLIEALEKRIAHFAAAGCVISDHGMTQVPSGDFTIALAGTIFKKVMAGTMLSASEIDCFRSAMLHILCTLNHKAGWVQQFHIGAIRNNSLRLYKQLGADIGCDSLADHAMADGLSRILSRLDNDGKLCKTVLYNLNPKDSEVLASMAYNFNDGSSVGKMQYGAAWWFLDQKDGIEKQLDVISNYGLLSRFIGMLTDSRSFLSFPRHEYFRRILCNVVGNDIQKGLLPGSEMPFIGNMIQDICYNNIKQYLSV